MDLIIAGFLILVSVVAISVVLMFAFIDKKEYAEATITAILALMIALSITFLSYSVNHDYTNNYQLLDNNVSFDEPYYNSYKALHIGKE